MTLAFLSYLGEGTGEPIVRMDDFEEMPAFTSEDPRRLDNGLRRKTMLAKALWGSEEHLLGQLLAPTPELPHGFVMPEYQELLKTAVQMASAAHDPRSSWLSSAITSGPDLTVGQHRFTLWEARCEVVRRAILHLGQSPES